MRKPLSLALRLTLLFSGAAAVVFAGFGWFTERSIEHHFRAGDARELEVIARIVSRALSARVSPDEPTPEHRFNDILVDHHGVALYVTGPDGRTLFASPGGPDLSTLARSMPDQHSVSIPRWNDAGHAYRVLIRRLNGEASAGTYIVAIALSIDYHLQFLQAFHRSLWLMIFGGIALMGLLGWIAVRQGHAPLRSIVGRVRSISARQLNTGIPPESVPRELTDLAVSFNDMLGRMDEAFQRLSNFSADIAHELRTPVTSLMTQTQVVLSQARSVEEYREILYSNMEEYERMAQMIGDMLFLAQADNRLYQPSRVDVDLARETQELFEYYEAWADDSGVTLQRRGQAAVAGDRLMLRRALGNLLSNAIRHTPRGGTVRVNLETAADRVRIAVENPGHAIAPEHLPRLFDRFYRADTARERGAGGAGLGLAIVKSIVEAHRGTIEVSSDPDRTRFLITLPINGVRLD